MKKDVFILWLLILKYVNMHSESRIVRIIIRTVSSIMIFLSLMSRPGHVDRGLHPAAMTIVVSSPFLLLMVLVRLLAIGPRILVLPRGLRVWGAGSF